MQTLSTQCILPWVVFILSSEQSIFWFNKFGLTLLDFSFLFYVSSYTFHSKHHRPTYCNIFKMSRDNYQCLAFWVIVLFFIYHILCQIIFLLLGILRKIIKYDITLESWRSRFVKGHNSRLHRGQSTELFLYMTWVGYSLLVVIW